MAKTVTMRGLQVFISDIRACQNKEQEQKRVDKELAKIRAKFGDDLKLSAYDRKKYVWKLLYIYMLGNTIEFGHKQACDLIPASKYSDKQVGYMAASLLLNENDEFLRLVINAIHNDLVSRNEAFQCLGLTFVANVGGKEMAEALTPDAIKLVSSGSSRPIVRKKAALALLRLIRKTPVDSQIVQADSFAPLMADLLDERDLGILISGMNLLLGIVHRNSCAGYESCQPRVISILERLVTNRDVPPDYTYYGIASPWLQCKCLRVLQFFPLPDNQQQRKVLHEIIQAIINSCSDAISKHHNNNKANALNSILFEAIQLCLHLDTDRDLLVKSVGMLGKYLTVQEPNVKYIALENMSKLALVPDMLESLRHHQATIVASLKDLDVSIRKRAMDLLFTMCDKGSADEIVKELTKYLIISDLSMREELVLKIAILAEKFAPTVQWYVDVSLDLLEKAGDFVTDDIWHRVVQLVTNNESMQQYAARTVVEVLKRGATYESLTATSAYILGEYGRLIAADVPPIEMFRLLHERFIMCGIQTKGLLMTAFMKLFLLNPNDPVMKAEVTKVFERYRTVMDADLQQRAVEYLVLSKQPAAASQSYFTPMPNWEMKESGLLRRLQAHEGHDENAPADVSTLSELSSVAVQNIPLPASSPSPSGTRELAGDLLGGDLLADAAPAAAPAAPAPPPPAALPVALGAAPLGAAPLGAAPLGAAPLGAAPLGAAPLGAAPLGAAAPPPAPAAAPAAAGPPASGIDILADLFVAPPAPPPPAAAVYDPFAASVQPVAPAPPVDEYKVLGDVQEWYKALLTKDRGVLYEDTYLQIGLQSRYSKSAGEIVLYLGNKSEVPLERVVFAVPPTPAVQVSVTSVPPTIAVKQQLQAVVKAMCLTPFVDAPHLQVSYVVKGRQITQDLKLPMLNHKFMVPEPAILKEVFFEIWKQYGAVPYKQQEMVDRSTPLSSEAVVALLRACNFGAEHGYLDPSAHNEAGAGVFVCGMPEQSVMCECRVEGNPQTRMQFRVTVATPNPTLSTTLKDLLVGLIRAA